MDLDPAATLARAASSVTRASASYELHAMGSFCRELFLSAAAARDLRHTVRRRMPSRLTNPADLGPLSDLVIASDRFQVSGGIDVLMHQVLGDHLAYMSLADGEAFIVVAAPAAASALAFAEVLDAAVRAPEPERADQLNVAFWSMAGSGEPRCVNRDITAGRWEQLDRNYGHPARAAVEELRALDACPDARLILWHGPPGTGKTHALRSLAMDWAPWCATHYVCDPEKLLTDVAGYLLNVVMAPELRGRGKPDRAKLLVLEDAGELMSTTARDESGQGLSRVLNLTDGMLGQGIDLMVLITTNEPLGSLHPAVTRPGRCLAEIEFGGLSAIEANTWLAAHGSTERVAVEVTLADLYAILKGDLPRAVTRRPVGFAA